jgi:hypothetical protein
VENYSIKKGGEKLLFSAFDFISFFGTRGTPNVFFRNSQNGNIPSLVVRRHHRQKLCPGAF